MTAPNRTDRFAAISLHLDGSAADRIAPSAFERSEPADPAPAYARNGRRLQRWVGDLLRERPGVHAKALAAGDALLASGFASSARSSGAADAMAAHCAMARRERLLQAPAVRAGLNAFGLLLTVAAATARAVARWREVATSAALIAAAGTICVFALFGPPERTHEILPDSTPDAAPPPAVAQPDGSPLAQLRGNARSSRSARH